MTMTHTPSSITPCRSGFTLLEMMIGCVVMAVLSAALFSVFSGTMHLREKTQDALDRQMGTSMALEIVRRDLAGLAAPNGVLASAMTGGADNQGTSGSDSLEFYTTAGVVTQGVPWGDVQQATYRLIIPEAGNAAGYDLVREVTRNLLPSSTEETPQEQHLLSGIQSLRFEYLDEQTWLTTWDSTANDDQAPEAVRMSITFQTAAAQDPATKQEPLVLVCEITNRGPEATEEESVEAIPGQAPGQSSPPPAQGQ